MKTHSDVLKGLPYFADLPDDVLSTVADGSEVIAVDPGTVIIEEGSHSEEMYVVLEGRLVVTKQSGDKEVELARLGAGEVVGEIALLDDAPRTATVTAIEPTRLVKVPVDAFEALLGDPRVVRRMFRTVTARLRDIEDTLRHEERMAALGRMAAQLMHELNNPAAAVARSSQALATIHGELGGESAFLARTITDSPGFPEPEPAVGLTGLARADAEDEVAGWLGSHRVADPWALAPALVDAGWTAPLLDEASAGVSDELVPHLARWIGLSATAEQVTGELAIGARRISELVRVVKDYSFLDQAPVQEIEPTSGIEDTLILLKHKLRDIEVVVDFEAGLPNVEAPGRDLNQVWTNLIDNAADVMSGGGTLTIRAREVDGLVEVSVGDTGPGIPPEVAERVFDPFFTTKEPGKGTGLGLHTVQKIISRVGGEVTVASSESGTTFTVRLPAVQAGLA